MKILGIETSCDETGAAVIEGEPGDTKVKLLSNVVASSLALHAKTGGIIPEVAAREQVKYIIPVIKQALTTANNSQLTTIPAIDAIAVTIGPGLIGSLLVGVETAKTLAYVWKKPIILVNHLIGHIYANWIEQKTTDYRLQTTATSNVASTVDRSQNAVGKQTDRRPWTVDIQFPALALIVSGGHTDLVLMKDHKNLRWIGGTRDDAAGEAFDKIGRLLGLPYPGGPAIAAEAEKFRIKNLEFRLNLFPRPMIGEKSFDFSFSGLKTAVYREVQRRKKLTENDTQQLAAETQQAIVDTLVEKTIKAAQKYNVKSILLSGGVAANDKLREELKLCARRYELNAAIFAPKKSLCTDNAAMIASAAFFNFKPIPWKSIMTYPSLHL